jgi:glutamate 5-kinase
MTAAGQTPADRERAVALRRQTVAATRRLVVKVGSNLLTGVADTPKQLRIKQLVAELACLRDRGLEVVLVTSGAIAAGLKLSGATKRPTDLAHLQALAAIGQSRLMSLYEAACQEHGFHAAQVLLSWDDVQDRQRHLNVRNCLHAILAHGALPIINENDAVSVEEIKIGDNDRLAALVGTMIRADLTVLLTTVDGLWRREGGRLVERLSVVERITADVRGFAGGTDGNPYSVGGMSTKLVAATTVTEAGESLWIADGTDFGVLQRVMAGEDVGTLFVPGTGQLSSAKRWLAFFAAPAGQLEVDDGAVKALCKAGKSLLPKGIVAVRGAFQKGDTVAIVDRGGRQIAVGVTNYGAVDLEQIKGRHTDEIAAILQRQGYTEVVHRNNLALV